MWTLDLCTQLLPSIKSLISSKYEDHIQVGSDSIKLILKTFGQMIKNNLPNSQVALNCGVDLSREERQRKANICYGYLHEIMLNIDKIKPGSTKLKNNFREVNLLMKTYIE
jgi:katanin p80 WD40 repeat-containing subunit B1